LNVTSTAASQTNYVVGVTATGTNTTPYVSTSVSYNSSTNALSAASHVSTSDERLKADWQDMPDDLLELLALVKNGIYRNIEDNQIRVGVGAQSLQNAIPVAVIPSEHGFLTVDYGPAAMVAVIALVKRVLALEAKLEGK
jgi:hypothetical protein